MRLGILRVFGITPCLALLACDAGKTEPTRTQDAAPALQDADAMAPSDAMAPADAGTQDARVATPCTIPSACPDVTTAFFTTKACCTAAYPCGYELPPLESATIELFPMAKDFYATQTKDDPNGRCAPESFYFGKRPGLWKHRVELENGGYILITPDCDSYTLAAFILPGCCLPDSTCGLSTDESHTTLSVLGQGPFTEKECVPAETLNQQLRDANLSAFARTKASGSCNHAALAAELPPETP